ncbi:uncharacterized protein [Drosophila bipectinata]|uniref:uncharacterized protein n=1 Tax=Drosophila bipectinata TaxID=42026 RepID=UPI0038B22E05
MRLHPKYALARLLTFLLDYGDNTILIYNDDRKHIIQTTQIASQTLLTKACALKLQQLCSLVVSSINLAPIASFLPSSRPFNGQNTRMPTLLLIQGSVSQYRNYLASFLHCPGRRVKTYNVRHEN